MQMAARGPSGSAYPGNDLPHLHGIPRPDCDGLQVVVRGDQPVAVVYFHAVPAAPGVPAGGPDHAGVGRIDPGAAACSEVLAQVEVAARTGDRADPEPERRAWDEEFQGRHEGPLRRAREPGRGHIEPSASALGDGPDQCAVERNQGPAVRHESTGQPRQASVAGTDRRSQTVFNGGRSRKSNGEEGRGNNGTGGQDAHSHDAAARRLLRPAGSPMIAHSLLPGWPARPRIQTDFTTSWDHKAPCM